MNDRNRSVLVFQQRIDLHPVTEERLIIGKKQHGYGPAVVHHQLFQPGAYDPAADIPRRSRLRRIQSIKSCFTEAIGQK
ncbi:hypothetical protein D3C81_1347700 [compost metagenome]